jgi:hypothetical protein
MSANTHCDCAVPTHQARLVVARPDRVYALCWIQRWCAYSPRPDNVMLLITRVSSREFVTTEYERIKAEYSASPGKQQVCMQQLPVGAARRHGRTRHAQSTPSQVIATVLMQNLCITERSPHRYLHVVTKLFA